MPLDRDRHGFLPLDAAPGGNDDVPLGIPRGNDRVRPGFGCAALVQRSEAARGRPLQSLDVELRRSRQRETLQDDTLIAGREFTRIARPSFEMRKYAGFLYM